MTSTGDYVFDVFEDWKAPTSASANLGSFKFNSTNSSIALLGVVVDAGAQRGGTGTRTEILKKSRHTLVK